MAVWGLGDGERKKKMNLVTERDSSRNEKKEEEIRKQAEGKNKKIREKVKGDFLVGLGYGRSD